jgi:hypothetical protein
MFWALLTALVAGVAGAGIGLGLRTLTRNRLPKGIIPICAGLAMIVATVGTEYGWYPNVVRTMAPDLVIISQREQQAWYQPWTLCGPGCAGLSAIPRRNRGNGRRLRHLRRAGPGQERWQPQIVRPNLVDCDGAAAPNSGRKQRFLTTANRQMRSGSTCRPTTRS